MSLNDSIENCAYCKAHLFPEDDTVYCPVCGAPHHRTCYSELGHCALESLHGTEKEYSRLKENTEIIQKPESNSSQTEEETLYACDYCGEKYPADLSKCPRCAKPNMEKFFKDSGIDIYGGVPKDFLIGENVTAEDGQKFILTNTNRYIPKFAMMKDGKKASWNWIAFLFPHCWLLSRKMYKAGIFTSVIEIVSTILSIPFANKFYEIQPEITSYEQMTAFSSEILKFGKWTLIFFGIGLLISLALSVLSGIFGDWFYRNHTLKTIKTIKSESDDISEDFRKKGGVNLLWFVLALFATTNLPQILYNLIS